MGKKFFYFFIATFFSILFFPDKNTEAEGIPKKIMVIIPEYHIRRVVPDPAGETEIIKVLIENGYRVVDQDQLARIRYNEQVKEAAKGNAHLASKIGNKYGADVIIVGEAFSESIGNVIPGGFITCRARIEARAVDTKTGEILAADGKYASGIDLGEFVAGKMAIQNAATELANYLVEYLKY